MWGHLYSDSQVEKFREEAKQELANTSNPLHPDYGDKVVKHNAAETIRETGKILEDRQK